MTDYLVPPEEVERVRELEARARDFREQVRAIKEQFFLASLEESARHYEAEANALREGWCQVYEAFYEALIADGTFKMPAKPEGLSFSQRREIRVVDPDAVPRHACAPVKKLLYDRCEGTETVRVWSAVVSAKTAG